jgi:hypothetical protein
MSQPPISRGFRGRRPDAHTERIPPGQHLTSDFPVLSAGPTPHTECFPEARVSLLLSDCGRLRRLTSAPTLGRRRRFNGIRVFAIVLDQNLERFF